MFGKKIVKRCPKGHEMELDWRRCPRCTGRAALHEGRDITEATVILGPGAAPADETRIVMPSQAGLSRAPSPPAPAPGAWPASAPPPSAPGAWPATAPPPAAAPVSAPSAPAAAAGPRSVTLECTAGPLAGRSFPLELGVHTLGKAPRAEGGARAIAVAGDRFLSKEHAVVTVGTAQVVLSDPGSTNGTFVNGERVTRAILKDGDEVRIGETFFRLSVRG